VVEQAQGQNDKKICHNLTVVLHAALPSELMYCDITTLPFKLLTLVSAAKYQSI
jgi:hypothetical protein